LSLTGELYAGRTLGEYELLLPLAQGATASVWAARMKRSSLEKIVAVKAMLTEFSDELDAESMFLDEARTVSRIRHPNVASVLDLGEEDDALYIVMEWVEGEPLQVLMRDAKAHGGIPMRLAVRIVQHAANGLHAAHELCDEQGKPLNIVHRDVSPQNILIAYDGAVKVIDFGVAKAASNLQKTSVGQIKGKVPYMAPEQAVGDPVDRRTDIFALGTVLYQLVTGKHPFRGENEFVTLARLRDPRPVDPPSTLVPVPAELEQVMLKALSKPRDGRFATMHDFARALEKAVPSTPDEAQVLSDLVRAVLTQRAVKKNHAIRDALRSLGHTKKPVNLSLLDEAAEPSRNVPTAVAQAAAVEPPKEVVAAPAPVAPAAALPLAPAPAVVTAPPFVDDSITIPGVTDTKRNRVKLIVAGVLILLAVVIAALALSGGSTSGDGSTPTKRAF
jgi:serine/threonine-protein kinase